MFVVLRRKLSFDPQVRNILSGARNSVNRSRSIACTIAVERWFESKMSKNSIDPKIDHGFPEIHVRDLSLSIPRERIVPSPLELTLYIVFVLFRLLVQLFLLSLSLTLSLILTLLSSLFIFSHTRFSFTSSLC